MIALNSHEITPLNLNRVRFFLIHNSIDVDHQIKDTSPKVAPILAKLLIKHAPPQIYHVERTKKS